MGSSVVLPPAASLLRVRAVQWCVAPTFDWHERHAGITVAHHRSTREIKRRPSRGGQRQQQPGMQR